VIELHYLVRFSPISAPVHTALMLGMPGMLRFESHRVDGFAAKVAKPNTINAMKTRRPTMAPKELLESSGFLSVNVHSKSIMVGINYITLLQISQARASRSLY